MLYSKYSGVRGFGFKSVAVGLRLRSLGFSAGYAIKTGHNYIARRIVQNGGHSCWVKTCLLSLCKCLLQYFILSMRPPLPRAYLQRQ